jgi:hypothetical protein
MADPQAPRPGVEIRDCPHCGKTGECRKGNTHGVTHSCAYCVQKSGVKITGNPFPIVPCAYCEGRGFHVIDLKIQKPQQKKGAKKGANNG